MLTRGDLERRRDEVLRVCERPSTAEQLLADLTDRICRLVPFSGSACFGLDPATMLASSPAWIENVDPSHCSSFWAREFLVEDTNLFLSMARAGTSAAALVEATDGRPARSARFREFLRPQGYGDELRALLRADRATWGSLSLFRSEDLEPFSAAEVDFVAGLARPAAEALRARLVAQRCADAGGPTGPGLLVFDRSGRLVNLNDAGTAWLAELPGNAMGDEGIPSPVRVLLSHALAVAEGRAGGTPRMRLRTARGPWAVLHASHLPGTGEGGDLLAVVVEPAASAEIAPLIVQAYALTPREQQVISALARGLGTAEIAAELHLSTHTVRDHVKAVLAKLGASTRGELVAKLFADHYEAGLKVPEQVAART
jgi:DNA-binding CsgD family transcriptional regulator